jgi:hypothetical protein
MRTRASCVRLRTASASEQERTHRHGDHHPEAVRTEGPVT